VLTNFRKPAKTHIANPNLAAGTLLMEDGISGFEECHIGALRLGAVGQFGCPGNASGGLTTFDDGSTKRAAMRPEGGMPIELDTRGQQA
jgi:hypothetical protein